MSEVDTAERSTTSNDTLTMPATISRTPSPEHEADDSTSLVPVGAEISTDLVPAGHVEGKKVKKIIRKKRRPARPQVDPATFKTEPPPQTGTIFNIWYNKWSGGDREDKYLSKTHAKSRCNLAKDTGYTRADSVPGSFICLFFARGICPRGRDCEYLHRAPTTFDIYSGNMDCFGRDKHSDYRDDMGGVGSFMRQNRTLYIGRIHPTDDIEEIVARHFQEWGTIERTRVLPTRGVAFVTYTTEALAQFAKEAMAHQSLDHEEILNVRWATMDPNPQAQKREVRKIEEQAADAIRRALPEAFVREIEGRDPEAKRRRKDEGTFGLEGYEASDDIWFESEKARMALERGQGRAELEAPPQGRLIEAGNGFGHHDASGENGGILSASTLSAIQNYLPDESKFATQGTAGALVNYASDEAEEDDW